MGVLEFAPYATATDAIGIRQVKDFVTEGVLDLAAVRRRETRERVARCRRTRFAERDVIVETEHLDRGTAFKERLHDGIPTVGRPPQPIGLA